MKKLDKVKAVEMHEEETRQNQSNKNTWRRNKTKSKVEGNAWRGNETKLKAAETHEEEEAK